ncbi:glycogen/starch/alpha-glucan phosphorylase [Pontibacter diazotrophicus]|uniref:Alpha-1,4 glucan phosphorylase n=1 Tax=Pontibacter diazotrophicus TaxID=1400979 RepID=A0A3D8LHF7_9BACT|nr:glycogen/starch/alpha-glucan phosphorylase [Pontibacter diazotrophicus]RDV16879.1 glycogen/starch/alpha-glucan phosphorylase [Pontibacter diazotrophicus]
MKDEKKFSDKINIASTSGSSRISHSKEAIKASFLDSLFYGIGRVPALATPNDRYTALALTIRDRIFQQFILTTESISKQDARAVAYLSAEYLPGPHLANNLLNLEITAQTREAMEELGIELDDLIAIEEEPGLGNGGLGRLASCYLDSLATLGIPAIAYGIRYEFGIFDQVIKDGWQVELTDKWLHYGNPWEVVRPEIAYEVKFGGRTEHGADSNGKFQVTWVPGSEVKGTAYDTPILGYKGNGAVLRLWRAEAIESFDFAAFNLGDYYRAVEAKMLSENITKVLYPNDQAQGGKELRLKQQYFFVTCSLQDIIRLHLIQGRNLERLHEKFAIQLNDTHPAIAIAELMRLLVDVHQLDWAKAWHITQNCFAYTNHTLLPEALEKWSIPLFEKVLPRHLEIIYEINHRFLEEIRHQHSYNNAQIAGMSIIDESGERYIRMAHLATIGSHSVNGVSAMHSELLKKEVLHDFAGLWPDKFCNVTNGITPRRFLYLSNTPLAELISSYIGNGWITDLDQLRKLEPYADDVSFQNSWMEIKLNNKQHLAALLQKQTGIEIDPAMLFDIQAKRIHEYKRQHLKVLHILSVYLRLKKGELINFSPSAFIFAGKAAPGYIMAKLLIKLINSVADLVNQDTEVNDKMKVVFMPDFNVKNAQNLYPAADLSEQISMAGMEASGTGNMKFSLNGALTIGTLDGANVEIRQEVGEDNFFLFGLSVEQVQANKTAGYQPYDIYQQNQHLREVLDFIVSGALSQGDTQLFRPLYENLLYQDPFMLLADYQSYIDCQEQVHELWREPKEWARKSILNVARMGKFSSDRSIRDYSDLIWKVTPINKK